MIATHNIKVNGRWIHAGEHYGEPEKPVQIQAEIPQEPETVLTEEPETQEMPETPETQEKTEKKARGGRRKSSR